MADLKASREFLGEYGYLVEVTKSGKNALATFPERIIEPKWEAVRRTYTARYGRRSGLLIKEEGMDKPVFIGLPSYAVRLGCWADVILVCHERRYQLQYMKVVNDGQDLTDSPDFSFINLLPPPPSEATAELEATFVQVFMEAFAHSFNPVYQSFASELGVEDGYIKLSEFFT